MLKTKFRQQKLQSRKKPFRLRSLALRGRKYFFGRAKAAAVLDQGLISGSNFVVIVLLARWLVPEQYGAYAVALGINVLLFTVYQSLLLEPMSVFGGSSYRECLRGYLGSVLDSRRSVCLYFSSPLARPASREDTGSGERFAWRAPRGNHCFAIHFVFWARRSALQFSPPAIDDWFVRLFLITPGCALRLVRGGFCRR